jgi:ABC-2 type transport system permease protein
MEGLSHELAAVGAIWWRDVIQFLRNKGRSASHLAIPIMWLLLFGVGMNRAFRPGALGGGISYIQFVFPGIVGMTILFSGLFSAFGIVADREFGYLKAFLVAPIRPSSMVLGRILSGATLTAFQALVMVGMAPLAGISLSLPMVLQMGPIIILFAFTTTAASVALAGLVRSHIGFIVANQFIVLPIFFTCGAIFPAVNLPAWMSLLVKINPATYAMDAMRLVALNAQGVGWPVAARLGPFFFGRPVGLAADLAITVGFTALFFALAVRAFRS